MKGQKESAVVHKEGGALRESYLALAAQAWAGELKKQDWDRRPEGLFGRRVLITTGGGARLDSESLDIEFVIPFDDDPVPNEAEIVIYNLSRSSIAKLRPRQGRRNSITVRAGYGSDLGVLFEGVIQKVKVRQGGVDKQVTVYAADTGAADIRVNKSYGKGTTAARILRDLADMSGFPVAAFRTKRDRTFDSPVTVEGKLNEQLARYAGICGVSAYISRGALYVRDYKEASRRGVMVSEQTGMIDSPEEFSEADQGAAEGEAAAEKRGYTVKMLLNHRIVTGVDIEILSRNASGLYTVREGTHRCDTGGMVTEVKAYE